MLRKILLLYKRTFGKDEVYKKLKHKYYNGGMNEDELLEKIINKIRRCLDEKSKKPKKTLSKIFTITLIDKNKCKVVITPYCDSNDYYHTQTKTYTYKSSKCITKDELIKKIKDNIKNIELEIDKNNKTINIYTKKRNILSNFIPWW